MTERKVSTETVSDKMQWIKSRMDEMLNADSQDELVDIYTEILSELGVCYAGLIFSILGSEKTSQPELEDKILQETEAYDEEIAEMEDTIKDISEESTEVNADNNETDNACVSDDEESPAYAVFYSLNNAAYVAVNERMRVCVPVRNLAKAYCVEADLTSVAQGQNELSKYKLDKLKPIQIKFLTQKEYDDTIGKAKAMQELMASMPKVENTNINTEHKVTNFATSNNKSSNGHIGEKSNNTSGYYDTNKKDGYDFFHSCPYWLFETDNKTSVKTTSKISMTDMIESPRELYRAMHNGIDNESIVEEPKSYHNDIAYISSSTYDDLDDFSTLITVINATIEAISMTKSEWLVTPFIESGNKINIDYMMDIDYSVLNDAIDDWNERNAPMQIMYVEDFDPTIVHFRKNIEAAADKYIVDEKELAAMAIYNYVRCLIAYEEFKTRNGIIA